MINRKFKDAGVEPLLAYIILLIGFFGLSFFLFYTSGFAAYIYLLIAFSLIGKLSETKRNEFLKLCFSNNNLKKIRIVENLIAAFPFLIVLGYKQLFFAGLTLIIITILLALVNFRTAINIVIPTPFYKKPFEFIVGFRNSFLIVLAAYGLSLIAVFVNNFNLGIFAMLLMFAITLSYYVKPEHEYYVWSHSLNALRFLFEKIRRAVIFSACLIFPIVMLLLTFFHQHSITLLLCYLAGFAFLTCMIVGKYAAYPDELNITQGILLSLGVWFPPLLIVLIPYLFYKSLNRLSPLLK